MTNTDLALSKDRVLPDALRVLFEAHPRGTWESHGNFGEMVQFWLQRHLMFRDVLNRIQTDTEGFLDRKTGTDRYAPALSRYGGFLLNQLHMHHQIEDTHYFPRLIELDRRLDRGFEMLETDHHSIDGLLQRFADRANAVLQHAQDPTAAHDAAGAFVSEATGFNALLDRHLTDEEDLVVPVILATGFEG